MKKKEKEILDLIIGLIIVVAVLGVYFNIPTETINLIIELLVSIFIGVILSMVAGSLIEAFTGNILKKISLNIPITKNFSISISVFVIATFIVKILLFGF